MKTLLSKFYSLHSLYLITILFLVTFVIYANTLANGLFYDDEHFIYNNTAVTQFSLSDFFSHSLITESNRYSNYYRPLLFLSFGIDYKLAGDSGFLYHFNSMMLHAASGIILFLFLKKLFNKTAVAFFTSLLWLIHPVQTEAVAYASGRGDPLSFFFIILTLYLLLFKKRKYYILSFITLTGALLSKEIALITPGLIFITFAVQENSLHFKYIINSLKKTLPFLLISFFYFFLRLTVLNFSNTLNFYDEKTIYTSSLLVRLNTFFHILPEYIKILFYPKDLFIDRDHSIKIQIIPTFQSIFSLLTYFALFCMGVMKYKSVKIILFSLTWFAISFVPTSGIIPINGIFYEHFLYFPSVGYFLLFSLFCSYLFTSFPKIRLPLLLVLVSIVGLLSLRTIIRNSEWHNPIRFYEATVKYVNSSRIYNNLAMAYADEGNYSKAIPLYQKAILLSDIYPQTHFNLANVYALQNDYKNAEAEYKKSLSVDPYFYPAHISLYHLYESTGNKEGSTWVIKDLEKLAAQNSDFTIIINQLKNGQ